MVRVSELKLYQPKEGGLLTHIHIQSASLPSQIDNFTHVLQLRLDADDNDFRYKEKENIMEHI